jgi:origin recognition complex subunit 1
MSAKRPPPPAPADEFVHASQRLRLSSVPSRLPCRDDERKRISEYVENAIRSNGLGAAMYVSGMPGTGKTATVHEVIKALRDDPTLPRFRFVEINGMRLPDPFHVYSKLWEEISPISERIAPKRAAERLERHFSSASTPHDCVVLLADELDHMVTAKQDVLYNLFEWPSRRNARLIVIGVANTMDLPERLGPKMQSRLGYARIVFAPYTREQVETIVRERLGELEVFEPGAVQMAARKVAASSGDVRRALQICSRAADTCRARVEDVQPSDASISRTVTIEDIMRAARELNESAQVQAIEKASQGELMVLIALGAELRQSGKQYAELSDIASRTAAMSSTHADQRDAIALAHGELLEVVSNLGEARLIDLAHSSLRDINRGPVLRLLIPDSVLSSAVSTSQRT